MPNETKKSYGTQWTLSSGTDAAIASQAVGTPAGAGNPYSSTQTGDYPDLELVLTTTFGAAPNENGPIDVHIVPRNVDGTTHARDIDSGYRPYHYASFMADNVSTIQTLVCYAPDVPKEGKIMLYNGCGAQISGSYTLKARPFTRGPV